MNDLVFHLKTHFQSFRLTSYRADSVTTPDAHSLSASIPIQSLSWSRQSSALLALRLTLATAPGFFRGSANHLCLWLPDGQVATGVAGGAGVVTLRQEFTRCLWPWAVSLPS